MAYNIAKRSAAARKARRVVKHMTTAREMMLSESESDDYNRGYQDGWNAVLDIIKAHLDAIEALK